MRASWTIASTAGFPVQRVDALGGDRERPNVLVGVRTLLGRHVGEAKRPPEDVGQVVGDIRALADLGPGQRSGTETHERLDGVLARLRHARVGTASATTLHRRWGTLSTGRA